MLKRTGFTLVELMISLSLSAVGIVMTASIIASTSNRLFNLDQVMRLQNELNIIASILYKDIQNMEYDGVVIERLISPSIGPSPFDDSIEISQATGETENSCITFASDLNGDGLLTTESPNEYRGYRLRNGAIEVRQNARGCNENGWQDLTSTDSVIIEYIAFTTSFSDAIPIANKVITITISASLPNYVNITRHLEIQVVTNNA
ncbi:prepilin-type N-terminal cleavage/methylation domain-containing protein [Alteromonas sp. 5E99-2]|uniref:prepilin-type N-terminal cleavage/methylation domain-containing protein n=1 Tax=Alteromonas sp. 5E99-2 TaxID=2817683 RepID=UPI001A981268|nr:prepilin-type N-terminal cleavage/methylation domain-containing protein [Alteromonas sp. 5E99-2]MBO1255323.1 prepilin-type N-terminal cleavage/methylation domain-containing protein [Alteromonas sp. 5E99-2]